MKIIFYKFPFEYGKKIGSRTRSPDGVLVAFLSKSRTEWLSVGCDKKVVKEAQNLQYCGKFKRSCIEIILQLNSKFLLSFLKFF